MLSYWQPCKSDEWDLTHSLLEPGGPCTKSMEVSESCMERVNRWEHSEEGFSTIIRSVLTKSGYTREKIRNLNDDCNDDCNSALELSDLTHERKFVTWMTIVMMIASRL